MIQSQPNNPRKRKYEDNGESNVPRKKRARNKPTSEQLQIKVDEFCRENQFEEYTLIANSPDEILCTVCDMVLVLNRPGNLHNLRQHVVGRSQKGGLSKHMKKLTAKRELKQKNEEKRLKLDQEDPSTIHCNCLKPVEDSNLLNIIGNGKSFYKCNTCLFFMWKEAQEIIQIIPEISQEISNDDKTNNNNNNPPNETTDEQINTKENGKDLFT